MAVHVRPATRADGPVLVEMVRLLSIEDSRLETPFALKDLEAVGFGERPVLHFLIAELDGRAVGLAAFYPSYDTDYAAKGFYMQDLYVREEARRAGVGRALVRALGRLCLEQGGVYLFWHTRPRNRAGRAFYRAIGAREHEILTLSLQPDALHRLTGDD